MHRIVLCVALVSALEAIVQRRVVCSTIVGSLLSATSTRGADCITSCRDAREKIAATIAEVEATGKPTLMRPMVKSLLSQGELRGCLSQAARAHDAYASHARDALEYLATVVEFDAFDKLTKDYQPKQAEVYTPAKLEYSLRALRAADRELRLWLNKFASYE